MNKNEQEGNMCEKLEVSAGDVVRDKENKEYTFLILSANRGEYIRMEELTPADGFNILNTPVGTFFNYYEIIGKKT